MEKLKQNFQELQDLQREKLEEYLEALAEAKRLQADSFKLIWEVEKAKEMLMR